MFIYTYDEYWKNDGWAVAAFTADDTSQLLEIQHWCNTVFGKPNDRWEDCIRFGEVKFSDKKDLTMFILRWS